MDDLHDLRRLVSASSDQENPSPETLRDLFSEIRRIAVIGLSRDTAKAARSVPAYLSARGYDVVPVNPHAERVMGRPSYPTVTDVPDPVDMVVIFRPPDEAGRFLAEAARRPERPAIWLQSGIIAPEAAAEARAEGLLVVQDMCAYRVHRALEEAA